MLLQKLTRNLAIDGKKHWLDRPNSEVYVYMTVKGIGIYAHFRPFLESRLHCRK